VPSSQASGAGRPHDQDGDGQPAAVSRGGLSQARAAAGQAPAAARSPARPRAKRPPGQAPVLLSTTLCFAPFATPPFGWGGGRKRYSLTLDSRTLPFLGFQLKLTDSQWHAVLRSR